MVKELSCDVLVAGGGPAGVAAAVAAARAGAKVLLVERDAGLGGNVRAAQVHSICGLYAIASGARAEILQGGLAAELVERLKLCGGASSPQRFGRLDVVLQEPEIFSRVCGDWVGETGGVETLCATCIVGGVLEGGRLQSVHLAGKDGPLRVTSGAVVEATGDGNLVASTGLGWERAPREMLQRPAYIFALAPVPEKVLAPEARLALSALLLSAVRDGLLASAALGAVVRPTCRPEMVRVTLDLTAGGADYEPCDEGQVARLTGEAAEAAEALTDFLRHTAEGFGRAEIVVRPERIGIRESRRVTGRHVITAEEILGGVVPHDTVCRSAWPLELHESGAATRLVFPRDGAACGVPLRALQSADADNVFAAGRCVSATHEAQASLRVIGTSLATGQAAGLAAAMVVQGGEPEATVIRRACES